MTAMNTPTIVATTVRKNPPSTVQTRHRACEIVRGTSGPARRGVRPHARVDGRLVLSQREARQIDRASAGARALPVDRARGVLSEQHVVAPEVPVDSRGRSGRELLERLPQ